MYGVSSGKRDRAIGPSRAKLAPPGSNHRTVAGKSISCIPTQTVDTAGTYRVVAVCGARQPHVFHSYGRLKPPNVRLGTQCLHNPISGANGFSRERVVCLYYVHTCNFKTHYTSQAAVSVCLYIFSPCVFLVSLYVVDAPARWPENNGEEEVVVEVEGDQQ